MLANGVGVEFVALGAMFLLTLLAVIALLEAVVARAFVAASFKRVFRIGVAANVFSFGAGRLLQPALDSPVLGTILPRPWARSLWSEEARWLSFFLASIAVEFAVWRWATRASPRVSGWRLALVVLFGNALTYAALYIAATNLFAP